MKMRLAIILCSLFLLARIVVSTECIIYELPQFDKSSYKLGESGVFSAIIEAEAGSKMNIYIIQVELFFDWERYTSSEVVKIPFGHTETINVTFSVPSSVLPGNYSYYYEVTYSFREDLGSPYTYTSSPSIITISSEDSFPWEYMVITVILIVIGIVASFIVIKVKCSEVEGQKENKKREKEKLETTEKPKRSKAKYIAGVTITAIVGAFCIISYHLATRQPHIQLLWSSGEITESQN